MQATGFSPDGFSVKDAFDERMPMYQKYQDFTVDGAKSEDYIIKKYRTVDIEKGKKILLIGASGLVGGLIAKFCEEKKYHQIQINRTSLSNKSDPD